jgi:hypothetical protein
LFQLFKNWQTQPKQGALQMNDEDSDSDLFGDLILTAVAIFFFILLVIGIGLFVWWLL